MKTTFITNFIEDVYKSQAVSNALNKVLGGQAINNGHFVYGSADLSEFSNTDLNHMVSCVLEEHGYSDTVEVAFVSVKPVKTKKSKS